MFENNKENEEEVQPAAVPTVKGSTWEIVKVFLISLAIVIPIRYFIAQPFIVRGASMEPNFEDNQYLIIDEISYYLRSPQRGEVIVFHYPRNPRDYFIKRVIGLPGEKVSIRNGKVYIVNSAQPQGMFLKESHLDSPDYLTRPDMEINLGKDEYFVMGDNRDFSSDSRIWGPLARNFIVGRVGFRAWPITRFGFVGKPGG